MDVTPIILTAGALRAALATMRQMGADYDDDNRSTGFFIDALNVLEALLDPAHQVNGTASMTAPAEPARPPAETSAPRLPALPVETARGIANGPAPTLAQEESQPAHADSIAGADPSIAIPPLPAAPDCAAPADRGPPAAEAAAPPAAVGHTMPEADHAPPGDRRPLRTQRITLTPAQEAKLRALWADRDVRGSGIRDALNALDGPRITNDGTLYGVAHRLGLRTRGELWAEEDAAAASTEPAAVTTDAAPQPTAPAPEPAARPDGRIAKAWAGAPGKGATLPVAAARGDDIKAEAFDAFDRGLTVRDIAADFGEPIATLSTWQAEWRLLRKQQETAA